MYIRGQNQTMRDIADHVHFILVDRRHLLLVTDGDRDIHVHDVPVDVHADATTLMNAHLLFNPPPSLQFQCGPETPSSARCQYNRALSSTSLPTPTLRRVVVDERLLVDSILCSSSLLLSPTAIGRVDGKEGREREQQQITVVQTLQQLKRRHLASMTRRSPTCASSSSQLVWSCDCAWGPPDT